MADLALLAEEFQFAQLVGRRPLRVDAVQPVQVDPFDAEVAEAGFELLTEVLGAAQRAPAVRS